MTLTILITMLFLQTKPHDYAKWEKEIAAIEKRLAENEPKLGGTAFIGSSSIRRWNLDQSFPQRNFFNLGFGGSEVVDSTHFAPRILYPLKPETIVFYAGDNDIANKKRPKQVAEDMQEFVKQTRKALAGVHIIYIPIKPSPKRWQQYETQTKANRLIQQHYQGEKWFTYLDIIPPMLNEDGEPRPELYVEDDLHLSEKGYAIWNKALMKVLDK